tara:strand:- start:431 stop:706 length:276 start_codon:yes stop_codon:yes gene_type:complete
MEDFSKWLHNALNGYKSHKDREMKRVFQWRRYLEWKDLTPREKLMAKRVVLIPVLAVPVLGLIKAYTPIIVTGLIIWFLYRKFEKGGLIKK